MLPSATGRTCSVFLTKSTGARTPLPAEEASFRAAGPPLQRGLGYSLGARWPRRVALGPRALWGRGTAEHCSLSIFHPCPALIQPKNTLPREAGGGRGGPLVLRPSDHWVFSDIPEE